MSKALSNKTNMDFIMYRLDSIEKRLDHVEKHMLHSRGENPDVIKVLLDLIKNGHVSKQLVDAGDVVTRTNVKVEDAKDTKDTPFIDTLPSVDVSDDCNATTHSPYDNYENLASLTRRRTVV